MSRTGIETLLSEPEFPLRLRYEHTTNELEYIISELETCNKTQTRK